MLILLFVAALVLFPDSRILVGIVFIALSIGILYPKYFFRGLLVLFLLLISIVLLIQTSPVQNWMVGQASSSLSKKLGTKVSISHVNFSLFNKMNLEGTYVEDLNKDTLLYAGKLSVHITDWFFLKDKASLEYIGLEDAVINMQRKDSIWNYQFLADFFSGGKSETAKKGIELDLKQIELSNIHFLKRDGWRGEDMALYLRSLKLDAKEINFKKKLVDVNSLAIDEPIFSIANYAGTRTYKPAPTVRDPSDTALFWNPDGWVMHATKFNITNGNFKNEKLGSRPAYYYFDGQHIQFSRINIDFKNFSYVRDTVRANIKISTKERSGFEVKSFTANMKWQPRAMEFSNLDIRTDKSHLTNYFVMKYDEFDDMGDFIEKVRLQGIFKNAEIHSDDLAFFAPELKDWNRKVNLTGSLHGTIDNLVGKGIILQAGNNTYLNGDISLTGLPEIDKTFIDFTSNEFRTTFADAASIIPKLKKVDDVRLDRLQFLRFKGNLTGFLKDFVAKGNIETALGNVTTDLHMKFHSKAVPSYSGKISSPGFAIGSFIENDQLGDIVFNGDVKGEGFTLKQLQANLDGNISSIVFNGYKYQNITVNGKLAKRLFNGALAIDDPTLSMKLDGLVDLSNKEPHFDFFASVDKANLKKLNLYKDDIDFNGNFKFNFTGSNIDNFLGTAKIYDASVFRNGHRLSFDSLSIESKNIDNNKSIVIVSNEFDAALVGEFSIGELPVAFQTFLNRYYPSYVKPSSKKLTNENFSFVITTKKVDDYLDMVDKNLKGFNNSNLSGRINSKEGLFDLDADVPQFAYKGTSFYNVNVQGRGNLDTLGLSAVIGDIYVNDSLHFPGSKIHVRSSHDISKINITTSANQTLNSANLSGTFQTRQNGFSVVFDPSIFDINGKRWTIEKNGVLTMTKDMVTTEGLRIYNDEQEILITSHPSETGSGTDLGIDLKKVNIGDFSPFLVKNNRLEGLLSGKIDISDPFGNMNVDLKANAEQFRLDDDSVGKLEIASSYSKATGRINLSTLSENHNYNFDLNGFINIADSTGTGIDLTTHLKDKTSIHILERYLTGIFSHLEGFATGDLHIVGKGKNMKYLGNLTLSDASMRVDYTKCTYRIPTAEVKLLDDRIEFNSFEIKDELNNTAEVSNSKLYHSNFKDMAFDFKVKTNRLLLLNTTQVDNKQFYGHAIGRATFTFRGPQEDMEMGIDAEATDSSEISLPIETSRVNGEAEFLSWKVYGKEMNQLFNSRSESNLNVRLKMTANNLAKINVILDQAAGDKISAVGHGTLELNAGTRSDLTLKGRFDIDKGDYTFTFQSIKRYFKLRENEGNFIQWNEDPYNADIFVVAEYRAPNVRFADLGINNTIGKNFNESVKQYIGDVLVKTTITNKLKDLHFKFNIELPDNSSLRNDPDASALLGIIERDENERNKQTSLLIVFNSFGPLTSYSNTGGINVGKQAFEGIVLNSVSGFISNQLTKQFSNVLRNVFKDPSIRFNINATVYSGVALTDVANQTSFLPDRSTVNFSINKSYFNERLTFIVGSALDFGFSNTSATTAAGNNFQFLPDVTFQYKLTPDGKILFNLFYRENRSYLSTALSGKQSRSGASVSYRREFDTFGELLRSKKKKAAAKPAPPPTTTDTSTSSTKN